MIDFLVLMYIVYGLFYTGTIFKDICNFVLENENSQSDKYDVAAIAVLTLLSILTYPFVMGYKKFKSSQNL